MNNNLVTTFPKIENLYDAFIVDIWGVVYDGNNAFEGASEAINRVLNSQKKVIFLSNTPRPSDITKIKLIELGIEMDKARIYTSGDAVREQLKSWSDSIFSKLGRKFYHLGEERNQDILRNLDVTTAEIIEDADFILQTLYMDEDEDLSKYDDFLARSFKIGLPMICANPDTIVSHGDKKRYCAGTFAKKYSDLGGIVHYYGKPDQKVFDKISSLLIEEGIDKSKILMIGDTMETDIFGAHSSGLDSLLLLTGNGSAIAKNMELLKDYSFLPSWIAPKLV